jgi:hypothetical protein
MNVFKTIVQWTRHQSWGTGFVVALWVSGPVLAADTPTPEGDSFWNTAVPVAKPTPEKKSAPPVEKTKSPEPPKEINPRVSTETQDRLDALEKRVTELSQMAETAIKTSSSSGWTTGVKEGAGFFWASPDKAWIMKMMGFFQFDHRWTDAQGANQRAGSNKPVSNEFLIRRARLDFVATVNSKTELFMELETGVGTANAAASDFGLIIGQVTHTFATPFQVRLGKMLSPFSNENGLRSSRALDTAERYAAVNTLVGLPAIEAQTGAMVLGQWAKGRYGYYLGAYNGNGTAVANYKENNSQKNIVSRLNWKPWAAGTGAMAATAFGVAADWDRELTQTLTLKTLGGTSLSSLTENGDRLGFSADLVVPITKWVEIRGEGLHVRFGDNRSKLYGGFGQVMVNAWKTSRGAGFSPLIRAESAVISDPQTESISRVNILTIGWNATLNKNVTWQMNYLPTSFRHQGTGQIAPVGHYDELINRIQVKF